MERLSELLPVGPPLSESQQIGRTSTIDSLEGRLCSRQVLKMLEPRRTGTTSVVRAALARIRRSGGAVAEVNLAMHATPEDVAQELAIQLAHGVQRTRRRLGGLLTGLNRAEGDEAAGEERAIAWRAAEDLLNGSTSPAVVIERATRAKGGVTAMLLDEAHRLALWPETAQAGLGAVLKDNRTLGVVIAASEDRGLEQLTGSSGPLEYVGVRFSLPAIVHEDWQVGLQERFTELGIPITTGALELLLEQSREHPYCTMLLAYEAGRLGATVGEVSEAMVRAALTTVRGDDVWRELS